MKRKKKFVESPLFFVSKLFKFSKNVELHQKKERDLRRAVHLLGVEYVRLSSWERERTVRYGWGLDQFESWIGRSERVSL